MQCFIDTVVPCESADEHLDKLIGKALGVWQVRRIGDQSFEHRGDDSPREAFRSQIFRYGWGHQDSRLNG